MSKHIDIGTANVINQKKFIEKIWLSLQNKTFERKTVANPPTVTLNTTATLSGRTILAATAPNTTDKSVNTNPFTFIKGGNISIAATSPSSFSKYVTAKHVSINSSHLMDNNSFAVVFDFYGQSIDIKTINNGEIGYLSIKVNGEYTSLTPTTLPDDLVEKYVNINFGSYGKRQIEIGFAYCFFGGVIIGATDTIVKATMNSPRIIIVGDSFTEGAGSTNVGLSSWASFFSDYTGIYDTWLSGVSGTGYLNMQSGAKLKFRDRIQTDVVPYNPDIVIIAGGANDTSFSTTDVYNEARALFGEIKQSLPRSGLIVFSPFSWYGVAGGNAFFTLLGLRDAIKQASLENGGIFIDLLEQETDITITGNLHTSTSFAATTFLSNTVFPVGSTIVIEESNTSKRRRCIVTGISGTTAPYTHTVNRDLGEAHSSGVEIKTVGDCFWTGRGKVGATTGFGNCDLFVSSDGQHPSDLGHQALGAIASEKIKNIFSIS